MMEKLGKLVWILAVCLIVAAPLAARGVDEDELEDEGRGIISDEQYEMMWDGGHIQWVWIREGVRLSDYRVDVGEFENLSGERDRDMMEELNDGFREVFSELASSGAKKGTLTTQNAVHWAEEASKGKRWIPFAGHHLAQAGVGVEMIFRNAEGEVVALVRHSAREGDDLEDAAEEIVEDIADWFEEN